MGAESYAEFLTAERNYFELFRESVNHAPSCYDLLKELGLLDSVSSVLSIGAGDGELEVRLAQKHGVKLGYIDPSVESVRKFRQELEERDLDGALGEMHAGVFEDYHSAIRYDLVLALHSWYAFGSNQSDLQKALHCVAPGGSLCIVVESQRSLSYDLACFSDIPGMTLTAEELSVWVREQGITHTCHYYDKRVPLDHFLRNGRLTDVGKRYVSFMTTTESSLLSPNQRSRIIELFYRHNQGGELLLTSGCLVIEGGDYGS